MILAFNKPFGILCQFSADCFYHRTLAEYSFPPNVYPIGRLDQDSEGLLVLSDEKWLVQRLLHPNNRHPRTYWAQVEHIPSADSLSMLARGVVIGQYRTLPCTVRLFDESPPVPPRNPPIRFRKTVPDTWVEIVLVEGKNRQVRRMLAAIGHPVLRLIRVAIGNLHLDDLKLEVGQWRVLTSEERKRLLAQ